MILGNAWIVTMDDAGTEHEHGWIRIEDGLVAEVGAGDAPDGRRGPGRRGRHAGPRQHPPPPLPDADARPRAAGRPLHVAEDALSDVGAHRRRDGVRRRARGPRRARALGLHDGLRPPLRLPARRLRARRGRDARRAGARRAHRRLARLDGPRRVGRRPAARLARRGRSTTILADTERLAALADGDLRRRSPSRRARRSRSRRG